jgi:hypothetical protein
LSDYYSFKASLTNLFRKSCLQNEIRLRKSESLEKILAGLMPEEVGVITTNWDTSFWNNEKFPNVIQLHGVCDQPESVVLPSEFVSDETLAEVLDNMGFTIADEKIRTQVQKMFRGNYARPLQAALQTAGFWLSSAHKIVLWGLALHPYDAEVCLVLSRLKNQLAETKEVIVINPDKNVGALAEHLLSGFSNNISTVNF